VSKELTEQFIADVDKYYPLNTRLIEQGVSNEELSRMTLNMCGEVVRIEDVYPNPALPPTEEYPLDKIGLKQYFFEKSIERHGSDFPAVEI